MSYLRRESDPGRPARIPSHLYALLATEFQIDVLTGPELYHPLFNDAVRLGGGRAWCHCAGGTSESEFTSLHGNEVLSRRNVGRNNRVEPVCNGIPMA